MKNIEILLLAAGASSRLGTPKQLLDFDGKTLLQKSIGVALETDLPVNVVLGANVEKIKPTILHLPINIIFNEKWATGQSSSIVAGIDFFGKKEKKINAVIIMLCDQPHVDVFLFKKIISVYTSTGLPIIATEYDEQLGVPALFDHSFFGKIKNIKGDKGAKKLIMNNLERVGEVIFEKGKLDIDTKEDYQRWLDHL